jgi:hypothetical protein
MIESPTEDSGGSASLSKCTCSCLPSCPSYSVIKAVVMMEVVMVVVVVVKAEVVV